MLGSPVLETALGLALVFPLFSLLNRATNLRPACSRHTDRHEALKAGVPPTTLPL